ncbi:NAD(P)H-dependent oxidoreductase subunit E [Thermanaerosceptrum fracticalcis]|jgi:NADH:ubiquinone oxidoreductase subunit E|uniref:NAD(P)H-dependent oxidoreductase subunit E n=1 Tax=Thermanaerosceptrum fracticalcis TaxID=1712410 RepID=A0A7G6E7M8_THEFR|nr:NAD(P)H-dependent oxidoreductase subunit E [Thermanaerosceptrum fracticalcis]QNB48082.1 NAD(P)H-dependent oxidoreductase subunit E [Thermanaerosceptrum fracticalcis]
MTTCGCRLGEKRVPNPEEFLRQHPDKKYQELGRVLARNREKPENLITVLHEAQLIFGYLPSDVQIYIADALDVPISEVYGVVTFYSLFTTVPRGKYTISVCLGTACYVKGAGDIMEAFKENLKIDEGETTQDGLFTLQSARCIGACGLAPVLTINNDIHGQLTPDDVPKLLDRYREAVQKDQPLSQARIHNKDRKVGGPAEEGEKKRV